MTDAPAVAAVRDALRGGCRGSSRRAEVGSPSRSTRW